jgi:GNAT superfamily N-acetyltransferase
MLRPGVPADLSRLLEIRDGAGADALSDPALATAPELARLIAAGAVQVWDEGRVVGFAAIDTDDGTIRALLVASDHRGKGIGRALLEAACTALRNSGHRIATLNLPAGGTAERHFRDAGWNEVRRSVGGEAVLQKPL